MTNKKLFKEAFGIDIDINTCPYGIPCDDCPIKDKKPNCTNEFWNSEAKTGFEGIKEQQNVYEKIKEETK